MNSEPAPRGKFYTSLVNLFPEDPKRYNMIHMCINFEFSKY